MTTRPAAWLILPCLILACGDSDGGPDTAADDAATDDDGPAEDAGDVPPDDAAPPDDADSATAEDAPADAPTDFPADAPPDAPADSPPETDEGDTEICVPVTCERTGAECGTVDDGCGHALDCGTCLAPQTCGHTAPNRCGCTPGAWTVETIYATDQAGLFSDVTTDAAARLHVGFSYVGPTLRTDGVMHGLRNAAGTWTFTMAATGLCGFGCTGVRNAVAVDGAGRIHLLYHDDLFDNPEYSRSTDDGATWSWSYVCPTCGSAGFHPALAIDRDGRLHALHVDSAGIGAPHYATLAPGADGSAWVDRRIDTTGGGYGGSITVDPAGGVHAAWDDPPDNDLRYAYRNPTTGDWSFESLADPTDIGNDTAIAADPDGTVHVLHIRLPAGNVLHSVRTPDGAWTTTTIDSTSGSGQANELVRGADGRLHAVWLRNRGSGGADLVYAVRDAAGTWSLETVPGTGPLDGGLGLAIAGNIVYVTCHHQDRQDLQLASRCPDP